MSLLASSIVLLILSLVSSNALSTEWCCSESDDAGERYAVVSTLAVSSAPEALGVVLSDSFFVDMRCLSSIISYKSLIIPRTIYLDKCTTSKTFIQQVYHN